MGPWDLQVAVVTRLKAFTALTDLLADDPRFSGEPAVYDHVPQDAEYPYIAIGDDAETPFDTNTTVGAETVFRIDVWSRQRGKKETKQIQRQIYEALHRHELSVSNANTVTIEFDSGQSFLDEDGLTRHGISEYRVITEEV